MRRMVVFDTLGNILLVSIRVREGKSRISTPVADCIRGIIVALHTAFTGSRTIPQWLSSQEKTFVFFPCCTPMGKNWNPKGRMGKRWLQVTRTIRSHEIPCSQNRNHFIMTSASSPFE